MRNHNEFWRKLIQILRTTHDFFWRRGNSRWKKIRGFSVDRGFFFVVVGVGSRPTRMSHRVIWGWCEAASRLNDRKTRGSVFGCMLWKKTSWQWICMIHRHPYPPKRKWRRETPCSFITNEPNLFVLKNRRDVSARNCLWEAVEWPISSWEM